MLTPRSNRLSHRASRFRTPPWARAFFEELEKRTSKAGIADLRKTVLSGQDLEMRFWYDHFEVIQGLIIRRRWQRRLV